MSIMCCKDCGQFIDTDDHPEAFYLTHEDGTETELGYVLCDPCKEYRTR